MTLLFHEFSPHIVQMFQFQIYFHLLMYHIQHVLNHLYHTLLFCIYYEFEVFLVFVDYDHLEYHQHLCQDRNLFKNV